LYLHCSLVVLVVVVVVVNVVLLVFSNSRMLHNSPTPTQCVCKPSSFHSISNVMRSILLQMIQTSTTDFQAFTYDNLKYL